MRYGKRKLAAGLLCAGALMLSAGCVANSGGTAGQPSAATTPVVTTTPALTAQQLIAYAQPWITVAEGIASALCSGKDTAACSDVNLAVQSATLAQGALASSSTTANLDSLSLAMAKIYQIVNANAAAAKPPSGTPAAGQ